MLFLEVLSFIRCSSMLGIKDYDKAKSTECQGAFWHAMDIFYSVARESQGEFRAQSHVF